jgi:hypothetical protein
VFGIGWLIIAIARATFPIFLTYSQTQSEPQNRRAPYRKAVNRGIVAGRFKIPVNLVDIYQGFSEFLLHINKVLQFYMGSGIYLARQVRRITDNFFAFSRFTF